jgi:glyoxylase-like metal-dependent hydrolase (beta-lactamase superfamily II)
MVVWVVPGGDARALFASVRRLLALPDDFKIWTGHDYPPGDDRVEPLAFTTVEQQRKQNKHVGGNAVEDDFVRWRAERDASLAEPRLIHQALQFNIRAGRLPEATASGDRLLHVPLKLSGVSW